MNKPRGVIPTAEFPSASRTDLPSRAPLFGRLRSPDAQAAWEDFLREYSPVLYQTVRAFTQDEEEVSDCFVHICEQLARNGFRRLLHFESAGAAKFSTWLRVVARNLCYDWHRRKNGRLRPFKSVQGLSALELQVYRYRYEQGRSREEAHQHLRMTWPDLMIDQLAEIESRIENSLNSRQHWLLSVWKDRKSTPSISDSDIEDEWGDEAAAAVDLAPDPETIAADRQQQARLHQCVALLPPGERLIVQLRFEDELLLEEIARLTGLGDAQRVHRRLGVILQKLRAAMRERKNRKTGDDVREIRQETR
jgi:RNA polymerase sigma factor (sigma-70 family)